MREEWEKNENVVRWVDGACDQVDRMRVETAAQEDLTRMRERGGRFRRRTLL